ncbi:MAG: hypothetical protein ACRD3T_16455 [Terriglobia bacterium]
MTTDVPAPGNAPYQNRRPWLIGFGAAEILIAGLLLLVSATQLWPGIFPWRLPIPSASDKIFAFIFYGGLGIWFFVIGIGSIKCRNWARIAMLVVSGVWLAAGAVSSLFIAFLIPKTMQSQDGIRVIYITRAYEVTMGGVGFFLVVLPVVSLVFYSRRSVKATCLARERNSMP